MKSKESIEFWNLFTFLSLPPYPPLSISVCLLKVSDRKSLQYNTIKYNTIFLLLLLLFVAALLFIFICFHTKFSIVRCIVYVCRLQFKLFKYTPYSEWWACTTISYHLSRIFYTPYIILVYYPILCCYHFYIRNKSWKKKSDQEKKIQIELIYSHFKRNNLPCAFFRAKSLLIIMFFFRWLLHFYLWNFFQGPSCFM